MVRHTRVPAVPGTAAAALLCAPAADAASQPGACKGPAPRLAHPSCQLTTARLPCPPAMPACRASAGTLTVLDKNPERVVHWYEPGNPDKPTGKLVIAQDTETERENACYSEPDSRRQVVKGEGIAEGLSHVGK